MAGQKNILLMVADDLGRDVVGCYGNAAVHTPNLDALAVSGSRFDLAFASTASCSGSRTTLYTGLHTHNNGTYGLTHEKNGFQTHPDIETAPQVFNQIGYKTGILGKVHVTPDSQYPWQVREESGTRNVAHIADRSKAFMQAACDEAKPFFLTVGFVDPHRDIPHRGGFGNEGVHDARIPERRFSPDDVLIPSWTNDLPEVRKELAEYYQAIHRMDWGIGEILGHLHQLGLADSTMVVFLSDNGPPFINSKTTLYEAGVRLPLLMRLPNQMSGIVNPHMVSWVDILPTFLDWAGHKGRQPAEGFYSPRRGRSILPVIDVTSVESDDVSWSRVFGSHTFHEVTNYWPTRYMRDRRYKYHRNVCWRLDFPFAMDLYASLSFQAMRNSGDAALGKPAMVGQRTFKDYIFRPPEELYDLDADPAEVRNLAADPAHKEKLLEMRAALEQWQNDTQDLWLWKDGTSIWRYRMHGYHRDGLQIPDRFDFDPENPGNLDPEAQYVELDGSKIQQTPIELKSSR
ncbi:putative mucin-desulfating sulfatase [Decorospora gaudefroyi]|uniref:Putative mucin-desulfating sulfatase n=1 Tax=Decorospora gaudefroyi TaxID=184978 RepID=A0A6A5JZS2_9PLEO|nr:putative mucin-desulfating sulfatase [Decorospora gaudefroyi]